MPSTVKIGGSGQYVPKTSSGFKTIPAGSSGELLNFLGADGGDLRLDFLVSSKNGTPYGEGNIEVEVDGNVLISGLLCGGYPSAAGNGSFNIQQVGGNLIVGGDNTIIYSASGSVGVLSDVIGKNIVVRKTSGSTSYNIYYTLTTGK